MTEQSQMQTSKHGLSPILLIFLITGVLGLLAAMAMLLNEGASQLPNENDLLVTVESRSSTWQGDDFTFTALTGENVSLAEYAGRPVFLNIWRTDCPPCVRELPAMQDFVREQGDAGAVVLAVNQGENPDEVQAFLGDLNITDLTVLLDEDLQLENNYPYQALPTTYVLDEDHVVRYTKIGGMDVEDMYLYLDAVKPEDRG